MNYRHLIILFIAVLLAGAMVAESTPHNVMHRGAGKFSDDAELAEEFGGTRRFLQVARFISYEALKKNRVPCGTRGHSYYGCYRTQRANPYRRGCTAITHCKRFTD